MTNNEEWKDIPGYEGLYQVSNLGNVKSLKHNTARLLKQATLNRYNQVTLSKNNIRINYSVHRLVAQAFIPNPNNLQIINHKDENKKNNRADNLEWCTQKYNINYGSRKEKVKKKLSIPVYQYDLKNNFIKKWECMNDAIRYYNNFHISDVCNNKRKTANGFIWKFC